MSAEEILICIAIALLFFMLGQVCPRLTELKRWRAFQAKRRYNKTQQYLSPREKGNLKCGSISVENIMLLYTFPTPETALGRANVTTRFTEKEKPIPKELLDLEHSYLQQEIMRARSIKRVFDNNLTYSLDFVNSSRSIRNGNRIHFLELGFSPTSFYKFAMINMALDKLLIDRPSGKVCIRDTYDLTSDKIDHEYLDRLPVHLKFGTNTIIVTKDNEAILSARSGRQYIIPGMLSDVWNTHISVAEGMLRPTDSFKEAGDEHPDPFLTVVRGLRDELNLVEGTHFSVMDIRFLALYLDIQRVQPIGVLRLKYP